MMITFHAAAPLSMVQDAPFGPMIFRWYPTLAWVKMFFLPSSTLRTYFNAVEEGFTKITGFSLFHEPSGHDHASCALNARHNAVTTFSLGDFLSPNFVGDSSRNKALLY